MSAHTKKNKTCFNIPNELEPFNLINGYIVSSIITDMSDMAGDIIGSIGEVVNI